MSHYVIYARKSSESDDRQVLSIPAQLEELRALALRRGLVVSNVIEESMSAKEPGRPKFGELIKQVQKGLVSGIFCWKLDRLARNPIDGAAVMWALTKKRLVEIVTPSRTFTGASDDVLLMSIEFGMAKKYVDDLSENVKRGQRARVGRGWTTALPPAGYLSDRNTHTVVKDTIRFPLFRRAVDLVLAGTRPSEALHALNQVWGYRTPSAAGREGRPMCRSTFYRLLGNPFYCGLFKYHGEIYRGSHEPMILPEEFKMLQNALQREGRPRSSKHQWAFTGLIRCGACGNMISAAWSTGKLGKKYPYYHCPRRHGCHQPYVLRDKVEQQVASMLERLEIPESIVRWYIETIDGMTGERQKAAQAVGLNREKTKRSVERQLSRLTDLRVRNVIRDEEYLEQREKLLTDLAGVERPASVTEVFEPAKAVILALNQAKIRFLAGDDAQKRAIFQSVCSNPGLLDGKLLILAQKPFTLLGERPQIPITQPHGESNPDYQDENLVS